MSAPSKTGTGSRKSRIITINKGVGAIMLTYCVVFGIVAALLLNSPARLQEWPLVGISTLSAAAIVGGLFCLPARYKRRQKAYIRMARWLTIGCAALTACAFVF